VIIIRKISQNHLLIRLFLVCSIFAVLFIGSVYSQNKPKIESNSNSGNQNAVKQLDDNETKLNEQMLELKKQIAELTQKVGDNKQASYDSFLNSLNFYMAAFGLIILIGGIWGFRDISKKVTESKGEIATLKGDLIQRVVDIKTDNTTILDRSEKYIGERIVALDNRITEFKNEQREGFERFAKEANNKIADGLSSDYQSAVQKIAEGSFLPQLNQLSEQFAELKTDFENFSNNQNITDTTPTTPEINQFDIEPNKTKSKEKNAFDE
jgi:uncharacterized membrane-anchored protein YhcB (DUF1043 family)